MGKRFGEVLKMSQIPYCELERYLENLNPEALKQLIRFVISAPTTELMNENVEFIKKQIHEFNFFYKVD